MLAQSATTGQTPAADDENSPGPTTSVIGVGIDTSRYAHYAAFLNDRLQTAALEVSDQRRNGRRK